jgi:hypothetical protein
MNTNQEFRTPYRAVVFGSRFVPSKRQPKHGRFTAIERMDFAYDLWTERQAYQEARLPSAGSFLFPGIVAIRKAAMDALALPQTTSVSIRTNQDRKVYRFVKQSCGCVSGYGYADGD